MSERISLREAYDDRSVIVKLARIEDTANDCKDASEKAVTSAQTAEASAKASLDACNAAKASAEQSAKDAKTSADVVATYDARLNDKVSKTGTATPQVISGTGGIQVQGDVSVGGDLTVAESGSVHMDGSDMEIAGMAIEKSGTSTVLSNELGGLKIMGELSVPTTPTGSKSMLAVNGSRLQNDLDSYAPMVRTTGRQSIAGGKEWINEQSFRAPFRPIHIVGPTAIVDTSNRVRPITCFINDNATVIANVEFSYSTSTGYWILGGSAHDNIKASELRFGYQSDAYFATITQDVKARSNNAIVTVGMLRDMGLIQ